MVILQPDVRLCLLFERGRQYGDVGRLLQHITREERATAWQYAAAQAIGLPDACLFPPGSYEGNKESVLQMLRLSRHFGINGLQAAGWTLVVPNPHRDVPVFPKMAFCLHPGAALLDAALPGWSPACEN